jgi:hypothetical protein
MTLNVNPNPNIPTGTVRINTQTFAMELKAAGLNGLPFAWGDDGTFEFDPSMTQAQIDAVMAVFNAHNPTQPNANDAWILYQQAALAEIQNTDVQMARIAEAVSLGLNSWNNADVQAWVNYRRALRAILTQSQPSTIPTALPTKPAYPAGT